ncbi:MAG: sugar ABC transporter permease [Oscillospiraceae bacterium]|nr:sugar ABC transporter permease [Oscillospiraceae bacterium]
MSGKSNGKAIGRRQAVTGYLFMLPWITGFLIFTAIPFAATIYLSFFEVRQSILGYELNFAGTANYLLALFRNIEFMPALISFLVMELTYMPTIVILSFILALLLNRPMKLRSVFRILFFLPVIVMSGPVMSQIMDSGAAAVTGLENLFVFTVIENYSPPLAEALAYLFENFSMVLWFTGIPIILFINGLQKINGSIVEAATIDSATSWQILWKITIPILRPIFLVIAIFTAVQLSLYSTNRVLSMIQEAIYDTVGGFGLASAYAWIYSLAVLAFIGVAFLLLREPKETPVKIQKRLERKWAGR